jgi:hypothetical protein
MTEIEFQEARKQGIPARRRYLRSVDLEDAKSVVKGVDYRPSEFLHVPFLGYALMCVPSLSRHVIVYPHAFKSSVVRTEQDFLSVLIDHEPVHIWQDIRKPVHPFEPVHRTEGIFKGHLSLLRLRKPADEERARKQVYWELHPFAEDEIEAYEHQLTAIDSGKRQCSEPFVRAIRKSLEIYRGVL